jgi:hypothetical protein
MTRIAVVLTLAAALPAVALAGCQSPAKGSGVTTVSPGVFAVSRLSVPNFYPMGFLRAQAMQDAVEHCKSLNRTMRAVEEKPGAEPPPGSNDYRRFDLTFACD